MYRITNTTGQEEPELMTAHELTMFAEDMEINVRLGGPVISFGVETIEWDRPPKRRNSGFVPGHDEPDPEGWRSSITGERL